MATKKLTQKQKDRLKDSDFFRSNSSDLTINKSYQDVLDFDDDGNLIYDKRTKEGREIDKILHSRRNRSPKEDSEIVIESPESVTKAILESIDEESSESEQKSKRPYTSTGTIVDVQKVTQHCQTPYPGREGRSYQKIPGGYINGAGALCWVENYVYLYWTNDRNGYYQYEDIRDTIKEKTNDARLTENRINKFLELNRGKTVDLVWEDGRWTVTNLDDLDYDIL